MNPYRQEGIAKNAMEPLARSSAANTATSAQSGREPEMAQAVRRLNECSQDLRVNLQTLLSRLSTVMRPEPPQPPQAEQPCGIAASTGVALLDWTNEKTGELQQAMSVVQSILDRLEI